VIKVNCYFEASNDVFVVLIRCKLQTLLN